MQYESNMQEIWITFMITYKMLDTEEETVLRNTALCPYWHNVCYILE